MGAASPWAAKARQSGGKAASTAGSTGRRAERAVHETRMPGHGVVADEEAGHAEIVDVVRRRVARSGDEDVVSELAGRQVEDRERAVPVGGHLEDGSETAVRDSREAGESSQQNNRDDDT